MYYKYCKRPFDQKFKRVSVHSTECYKLMKTIPENINVINEWDE